MMSFSFVDLPFVAKGGLVCTDALLDEMNEALVV